MLLWRGVSSFSTWRSSQIFFYWNRAPAKKHTNAYLPTYQHTCLKWNIPDTGYAFQHESYSEKRSERNTIGKLIVIAISTSWAWFWAILKKAIFWKKVSPDRLAHGWFLGNIFSYISLIFYKILLILYLLFICIYILYYYILFYYFLYYFLGVFP